MMWHIKKVLFIYKGAGRIIHFIETSPETLAS